MTRPKVAAVVLAAGSSTRMQGSHKLLELVGGLPMVPSAVAAALEVGARDEMAGKRIVVIIPSFAERYLSTDLFSGV